MDRLFSFCWFFYRRQVGLMRNRGRGRRSGRLLESTSGGVSYDPVIELSALHGWDVKRNTGLDASAIASVLHLGSASGSDLTPLAATKEPLLKLAFINGKNVALFDGVNDSLFTAVSFPVAVAQPFWVFGLWQCPAGVGTRRFFDSTNRCLFGATGSTYQFFAGTTILTGGTLDTSPHWFACLFDGANSSVWRDDIQIITGNPGAATLVDIYVGSDNAGAALLDGYFGEVYVSDGTSITATKRTQSYTLGAKPTWGL